MEEALALAIALSLPGGPGALGSPSPPKPSEPVKPEPPKPSEPVKPVPPKPSMPLTPEPPRSIESAPPSRGRWVLAAGPVGNFGGVRAVAAGIKLSGAFAPIDSRLTLSAGALWLPPTSIFFGAGTVDVSLVAAEASACWPLLGQRTAIRLDGCGHVVGGALRGIGRGYGSTDDRTRLWLATGVGAAFDVPVSSRISTFFDASALVPWSRESFAVRGVGVAYEPPALTVFAGFGLRVRIE